MSLEPPITQRDVDQGTVFVRRDGEHLMLRKSTMDTFPWIVVGGRDTYTNSGRWGCDPSPLDLISRLPKGEKMESQVVVKDERENKPQLFKGLPGNALFEISGSIFRRLSGEHKAERITGTRIAIFVDFDSDTEVKVRHDLRLELVLKNA